MIAPVVEVVRTSPAPAVVENPATITTVVSLEETTRATATPDKEAEIIEEPPPRRAIKGGYQQEAESSLLRIIQIEASAIHGLGWHL